MCTSSTSNIGIDMQPSSADINELQEEAFEQSGLKCDGVFAGMRWVLLQWLFYQGLHIPTVRCKGNRSNVIKMLFYIMMMKML